MLFYSEAATGVTRELGMLVVILCIPLTSTVAVRAQSSTFLNHDLLHFFLLLCFVTQQPLILSKPQFLFSQ